MPFEQTWRRVSRFLQHDVWHLPEQVDGRRSSLLRLLRIVVLAGRGFVANALHLRASALTYYSLLSIVPALALAFGIAKGFGLEAVLERALQDQLAGQQEIMDRAVTFARSMLQNTRGGLVAGVGVVVLLWSVVRLLGNIEASFNAIWGVSHGRTAIRKLTDYLAVMILAPLLLLISSSSAVFISGRVNEALASVGVLEPVDAAVRMGLEAIPYVLIWLLLTLLYLTMPNTRVSWRAGLAAGVVAGTLYQLLQFGYFQSVVNVARYNAIYGSFAVLPLFLIWLHLSWLVVLVGAEVSFAVDNAGDYAREWRASLASHHQRRLIALGATAVCADRFLRGEPAADVGVIAERLDAPRRLVRQVLGTLVRARVLTETRNGRDQAEAYQPAADPRELTVLDVVDAFDAVPESDDSAGRPSSEVLEVDLDPLEAVWRRVAGRDKGRDDDLTLDRLAAEVEIGEARTGAP